MEKTPRAQAVFGFAGVEDGPVHGGGGDLDDDDDGQGPGGATMEGTSGQEGEIDRQAQGEWGEKCYPEAGKLVGDAEEVGQQHDGAGAECEPGAEAHGAAVGAQAD